MHKLITILAVILCLSYVKVNLLADNKVIDDLKIKAEKAEKSSTKIDIYMDIAQNYYEGKQYDKSVEASLDALSLHPKKRKKRNICRMLGDSFAAKKEYSKSIEFFR